MTHRAQYAGHNATSHGDWERLPSQSNRSFRRSPERPRWDVRSQRPIIYLEKPALQTSAVSMKVPPAAKNVRSMLPDNLSSASAPKVMVSRVSATLQRRKNRWSCLSQRVPVVESSVARVLRGSVQVNDTTRRTDEPDRRYALDRH